MSAGLCLAVLTGIPLCSWHTHAEAAGTGPALRIRLWGRGAWSILYCEPAVCQDHAWRRISWGPLGTQDGGRPLSQVRMQAELSSESKVTLSKVTPLASYRQYGLEVTFLGANAHSRLPCCC